jgi:eukaryotic-like serine/threonine-protein kinase
VLVPQRSIARLEAVRRIGLIVAIRRTCEECEAELPANAPQGLCPRCLAHMGLGLLQTAVLPESDFQVERTGTMIGRYKLLEKIGEGGFGVVYMAEQVEPVQRKVALKIIKAGMDTREVIARFEAERQAIALMDHPNIARALDAGATEAGRPYFVMELVRGIPITEYCDQSNLPTRERLQLFMKVCQAVQHAHQKGVIHRDIKPSNVLVTEHDGQPVPKVIDFGVAKALGQKLTEKTLFTGLQHMIGTPAYMSPEQAALSGLDIDTRADIYSLGVLLYELLTGVTPFDADLLRKVALDEIRRMICEAEPPRPSTRLQTLGNQIAEVAAHRHTEPSALSRILRGDLDWIVMCCLEKDRKRRYETANGLAADLARHLNSEAVFARPPSNLYRFQKLVCRHKLAFAAAGAVTAALVIGLGVSTWSLLREKQALRRSSIAEIKAKKGEERAEAAAIEVKMTLADSDYLQAVHLIADDHGSDALAYLARSLAANPTNGAALARLMTLLTYHSWMVPRLTLNHERQVTSAEFSSAGKRVVTTSGNTTRAWDSQSGQLITERLKQDAPVDSAQVSPDGERIVTNSTDTVRVRNAQSGQPITPPLKQSGDVCSAQFSPDGKLIFTTSTDYAVRDETTERWCLTARVWDAQSGKPVTEPLDHGNDVWSARFSVDGKRIVTISSRSAAIVWDAQAGPALTERLGHNDLLRSAQFSPDGKQILTGLEDGTAWVWDAQRGVPVLGPLRHGRVRLWSARFSPDGTRIATASVDGTARVWDARSGQPLTSALKHDDEVRSAEFSPDGKRLLTASNDKTARVWDAQSGRPLTEPLRHDGVVRSAKFSPDGRRIVTASVDGTARVWDAQSGKPLTPALKYSGWVGSVKFSPDGTEIVMASPDGTTRVWDAQGGQPLPRPMKPAGPLRSAEFSPDGKQVVTASENGIACIWDAQSGRLVTESLQHGAGVMTAQFSPDGMRIVTASEDGTARLWDARTGRMLTKPLRHAAWVESARFSPDGKRILTVAMGVRPTERDATNATVHVWDAQSGQPLAEPLEFGSEFMCVASAQFSPDGKRIVTASDGETTARVWDCAPSPATGPDWLLQLAEAISGKVLNKQNVFEATKLPRVETLDRIRQKLAAAPDGDDWVVWGRWFLADPRTRAISPFCSIPVREYIETRIKEHTTESLDEAERLAAGNLELLQRIARERSASVATILQAGTMTKGDSRGNGGAK